MADVAKTAPWTSSVVSSTMETLATSENPMDQSGPSNYNMNISSSIPDQSIDLDHHKTLKANVKRKKSALLPPSSIVLRSRKGKTPNVADNHESESRPAKRQNTTPTSDSVIDKSVDSARSSLLSDTSASTASSGQSYVINVANVESHLIETKIKENDELRRESLHNADSAGIAHGSSVHRSDDAIAAVANPNLEKHPHSAEVAPSSITLRSHTRRSMMPGFPVVVRQDARKSEAPRKSVARRASMASSQNIAAYVPTVHSSGVSSGSSIGNTDAASGKVVVKGGVKDIDSGTSRITEEDNQDSDTVRSRRRKSVNPATIGSMLTEAGFRSPSRTGEATVHMGQARTGSEHRSISKEPTHDLASTKRNESESVDNQPFEEPLAKRFRTRKLVPSSPNSGPMLRKRIQIPVKEPSAEPSVASGPPLADFEFSGSSAVLGGRAQSHESVLRKTPDVSINNSARKGILKMNAKSTSKRRLAFIDESAEDQEKRVLDRRNVDDESQGDGTAAPNLRPVLPQSSSTTSVPPSRSAGTPSLRILSWNIAGLRAFLEKSTWREINACLPDVICLQETKVERIDLLEELGVHVGTAFAYWHNSIIKGHAGVAILSKNKPLNVIYGLPRTGGKTFAEKGHLITAEYEQFYVVNAYVPNSSVKLVNLEERLAWDVDFRHFLGSLQAKKPVIVAGDLNCARLDIDLFYPDKNHKNPGFTDQERHSLEATLKELKLTDVFRMLQPGAKNQFTFWSARTHSRPKNIGWRLDYFLVSETLIPSVCDMRHLVEVEGSDHCPIVLYLDVPELA